MEFDIRAISLVESIPDACIVIPDILGKEIEFRVGIRYSITLPTSEQGFERLVEPRRTMRALFDWARFYRYPDGRNEKIHVLANADNEDGDLSFYRLDLLQAKQRRGPRPPVELIGSAIMTRDECATWLIELAHRWALAPDERQRQLVLSRPSALTPDRIRLAWLGPELVSDRHMPQRLTAIGQVYGAEVIHVLPRAYREVEAQLAGSLPLDAVVVCQHFAPHLTVDVVPSRVPRNLVHFCESREPNGLEQQVRTWIEIAQDELRTTDADSEADEMDTLLAIMLRGMMSHAKIGQYKHCPKETLLKGIRARRLNVATAERVLDHNCETFQETKESEAIFLSKEHNDGRQYFLNPRRIEYVRQLIANNGRP